MNGSVWPLARIFLVLSILSIGGGNTILPEMQRQVVETQHWMTARQFGATFALAQAAPGPNIMIVPLVGWRVGGVLGLVVSSFAMFVPTTLLTIVVIGVWDRFKTSPVRARIQRGLSPIAAGLLAASALIIARAAAQNWGSVAIFLICAATMTLTRRNPVTILALGALLGLTGLGQR